MSDPTPSIIDNYFEADARRDVEGVVSLFSEDAEVLDEGKTWRGIDRIRAWREGPASKYEYTTRIVNAQRTNNDEYVLTGRLEGNFPGGTADLRWRFTLTTERIKSLSID